MNKYEQLKADIAHWEAALPIWTDALEYAKKHNIYADIEFYSHMIDFAHENISAADRELKQLKSA